MTDVSELASMCDRLSTGAVVYFSAASNYPEVKRPTVLLVHGWKSDVFSTTYTLLRDRLNDAGFHTLSVSLRGHTLASGDQEVVSRADHEADLNAAYYYLQRNGLVDDARISAVGASYGAYMLANMSANCGFENLVFRAPALYDWEHLGWDFPVAEITKDRHLHSWRSITRKPEELKVLEGFSSFTGHVLLVLSEFDEQMPPAVGKSYAQALMTNKLTTVIIADAEHRLEGAQRDEFAQITTDFLLANTQ